MCPEEVSLIPNRAPERRNFFGELCSPQVIYSGFAVYRDITGVVKKGYDQVV